jgi:hypothetical protein
MIKRLTCKLALLTVVIMALQIRAYAQFEEGKETIILATLQGAIAQLNNGANVTTTYAASAGEVTKTIKNIVTFKLNEKSLNIFFKTNFTATVNLKIESWASSNPLSTTIQTQYRPLTINYDTTTGAKYNVSAYILLPLAEQVKVTIDTITITGNVGYSPTPMLVLENEMRVLRYFNLSSDTNILKPATLGNVDRTDADSIYWTWNPAAYNNMSQLEWAWVPTELAAGYYASTDLIFQNNSSRVDLDAGQNNYKIPLLYADNSTLYYRVRAALRKNNGTVLTGPWSAPGTFQFAGKDTALNWQSSTSFAENGKFKTVIQYFDGTLRSRQTVTKDNSTGNTVVAETIYDLQGRANLQILPTPTIDGIIKYYRDFNRFDVAGQINSPTNTDDPAKYFDLSIEATKCNGAPKLDTSFGNGKYYSYNNPWLALEEKSKYIPHANGYGYTETRYMDDATQRVSMKPNIFMANHRSMNWTHCLEQKPGMPATTAKTWYRMATGK